MAALTQNRLLDALLPHSLAEILHIAREISLPLRTQMSLTEQVPQYAYFMTSGLASVVVGLSEGGTIETGSLAKRA